MPADRRSLRFWLLAMDAVAACGGFGSRLYLWCVGRASGATDYGPALAPDDGSEVPF